MNMPMQFSDLVRSPAWIRGNLATRLRLRDHFLRSVVLPNVPQEHKRSILSDFISSTQHTLTATAPPPPPYGMRAAAANR